MKRIVYLSVAEAELVEAVDYYETREKGLARKFLDAVRQCELLIGREPELCSFYEHPFRSARLERFP